MRAAIVLVGAACGSAVPPPPPIANASEPRPPPLAAACPHAVQKYVWGRELFPGCPPMPFANVGITCARDRDCPHPCRMTWRDGDHELFSVSVRYDAQGRWLETESANAPKSHRGRPDGEHFCHRDDDGVHGACAIDDGTATRTQMLLIYRDNRVVGMRPPEAHDLTAMFDYDGGRLVRERWIVAGKRETSEFDYDARGRVATVRTRDDYGHRLATFHSDANDRVVSVADEIPASYRYDDAGRLVEIRYGEDTEDLTYDCGSSR